MGGGGGWWSQLLRDQSVGPPPRIGFDRLDQFHPGPGFRVLDFLLESASLLPVALVAAGDLLFVTSPLAPSPLESSPGQRAFSSEFRDLLCPPVGAAIACSAAGWSAASRRRKLRSCPFAGFPLPRRCRLLVLPAHPSSTRIRRPPPGAGVCPFPSIAILELAVDGNGLDLGCCCGPVLWTQSPR
jgi:hypothetical protein